MKEILFNNNNSNECLFISSQAFVVGLQAERTKAPPDLDLLNRIK